jgi:DNA invertase Pin-like site-specific DNA recombinase
MELAIKRERIHDNLRKKRAAGKDLGRRWQQTVENRATRVAKDLGMSCATLYGAHS